MTDKVLARVQASPPRRVLGVAVLAALGLSQIYFAFVTPPVGFGFQALLIGIGAGALWLAVRMWQVTRGAIELTMTAVRLDNGTLLALTDDIAGIERGAFAFKPSHGFTLRLRSGMAGAWHPGLWWRIGRRIGIGGVTSGTQTKIMADMIAAMIAARHPQ